MYRTRHDSNQVERRHQRAYNRNRFATTLAIALQRLQRLESIAAVDHARSVLGCRTEDGRNRDRGRYFFAVRGVALEEFSEEVSLAASYVLSNA